MDRVPSPTDMEIQVGAVKTLAMRPRDARHVQAWSEKVASMDEVFQSRGMDSHHASSRSCRTATPRCPETIKITHDAIPRSCPVSPTASTISTSALSVSSTYMPDSATTRSLASMPLSPTFSGSSLSRSSTPNSLPDTPDRIPSEACRNTPRPASHRRDGSRDSESTFVDDDAISVTPSFGIARNTTKISSVNSPSVAPDSRPPSALGFILPRTAVEQNAAPKSEPPKANIEALEDAAQDWETAVPDLDDLAPDDADAVLDYVLQLVYGVDLDESSLDPTTSRQLVSKFAKAIAVALADGAHTSTTQLGHTASTSSNSSRSTSAGFAQGGQAQGGKRKKTQGNGNEEDDDLSEGGGEGQQFKRPRPNPAPTEENLRLSCPFRKRNPHRFNVRDHYSCSMTYFPKFAELRYVAPFSAPAVQGRRRPRPRQARADSNQAAHRQAAQAKRPLSLHL